MTTGAAVRGPRVRFRRPPWLLPAGALVLAVALGMAAHARLAPLPAAAVPTLTRLTFRRGAIESARFSPDGQTIVYAAHWDGAPPEVFTARRGSPESRPLGFRNAELLALSRRGEMALSRDRHRLGTYVVAGTLSQAPLAGGTPRDVYEDVLEADWTADGTLSIVRRVDGRSRLERPRGNVLYETAGWISHHRNAPSGGAVAFIDHPVWGDDAGNVMIVDEGGSARALSRDWGSAQGLSWSPDGREVWFTGMRDGSGRALHAVTRQGRERTVCRMAGTLLLHDVHAGGQVLLSHQVLRREVRGTAAGGSGEVDLSWLDYTFPADLSDDGRTLFFAENAEGGGPGYSAYVRRTDGSPAVRLGGGAALALSPDGRRVLVGQSYTTDAQQLVLFPTGAGDTETLPRTGLRTYAASFFPNARSLLVAAHEPGQPTRTYVHEPGGGAPRRLADASFSLGARPIAPDGRQVALRRADGGHQIVPVDGGPPREIVGAGPDDQIIRWNADGRSVFVYKPGELPARVDRLELATGRREAWKEIRPADAAGVVAVAPVLLSADGHRYVYGYRRVLSDLYIVDGLR